MRYQYTGPNPDETSGELIRPGDVREFSEQPDGPWECIDPEAGEGEQPGPPEASPAAFSAAPALNLTPAPAATPEGM